MILNRDQYTEHPDGTLELKDKTPIDYLNYWNDGTRSTLAEQVGNLTEIKFHGINKVDSILQFLKPNTLFEIGCAPGELMRKASRYMNMACEGIEPSQEVAEWVRDYTGCLVTPCLFDDYPEGRQFDSIVAMDVLEHIVDGPRLVDKCRRLLRPGGIMIFMLPLVRADGKFDEKNLCSEHYWIYSDRRIMDWLKPIQMGEWTVGHEIVICQ